jgi:hypothetical protein
VSTAQDSTLLKTLHTQLPEGHEKQEAAMERRKKRLNKEMSTKVRGVALEEIEDCYGVLAAVSMYWRYWR